MQPEVLSWEDIAETAMPSTGGTVLRRFLSRERLTVAKVGFEAGAAVPEHAHINEQIAFVLSGRMEFTIAGEPQVVEQGQMIYLPGNVIHGAKALEASVLIDIFSPPRTDWEITE